MLRMDPRLHARLDPSDIVQETQMVAYRRFEDFLKRRPMPFQLWLRKTAHQQVCVAHRTHIDRRRRSVLREKAGLSRPSRVIARGLLANRSSAFERLQRQELEQRVATAVAELSDRDRETIIMRNVEDLSFEEIAVLLDQQPPAVRQRYGRAMLRPAKRRHA
jgi:RNA polymerase sigma-70 factor (ECF subfamily)